MALHPDVEMLWQRLKSSGFNGYSHMSVASARTHFAQAAKAFGRGPEMAEVRDLAVPISGNTAIPARLYRPDIASQGLCIYFHGGGWCLGGLDDFDTLVRTLAQRSGAAFLSVDYRLAPEHPFPTPLEDAVAAIRWAAGGKIAGSFRTFAVAGDSAGANLATVAALELKDEIELALQLLFNPATDTDTATQSYALYGQDYLLKADDMTWFLRHYLGGTMMADPRIAPLRAELAGAPPAWIALAEFDVLRSEGEAYAAALERAGVPVQLQTVKGVMHGFARQHGAVDVADQAVTSAAEALQHAFSR